MFTVKRSLVAGLVAAGVVASGFTAPALAGPRDLPSAQAERLNAADAAYTGYYYRGRGARNAAIAGAVGLGVLGLAAGAVAASRQNYGPAYEYEAYPAYGYRYQPVYEAPVVYERRVHAEPGYYPAPRPYYRGGYYGRYYEGVDPARSTR